MSAHTLPYTSPSTNLLQQQSLQLVSTVRQTFSICGVNDPDQRVRLLEVVLPVRSESLLAADIPFQASVAAITADERAIQIFSLYLHLISVHLNPRVTAHLPIIIDRLDDEPERWAHRVYIFIHNSLHNRGFASVVQATFTHQPRLISRSISLTATGSSSPCL
jgi:hypothetical protein